MLVDTSVWVDHLRHTDPELMRMLTNDEVLIHPFVIGELALGNIPGREAVLDQLDKLPRAVAADEDEVLHLITSKRLQGLGIGYVNACLLASLRLTAGSTLWTRDKHLEEAARGLV